MPDSTYAINNEFELLRIQSYNVKVNLRITAANVGTRCSTNGEDALVHLGTSSKSLKASLKATRNLS